MKRMGAIEIAAALGGRREGREWRCPCPLHGGRSFAIRDGEGGRLLVRCWGGCDSVAVLTELRRIGLLDSCDGHERPRVYSAPRTENTSTDAARTARALDLWHESRPIEGTIAELYLRSRGISFDEWPTTLRLHPHCPHPNRAPLPALIALVEHVERGAVAIHRTFLRLSGQGRTNCDPDKAGLGPVAGGAVRFGVPRKSNWLVVAEGIETTLSVATACGLSAWAALSEGGIRNLILPPEAEKVLIAADHDDSGVGQRAARNAAERFLAEGRRVRIAMPPEIDTDFNDLLTGRGSTKPEVRNVAA